MSRRSPFRVLGAAAAATALGLALVTAPQASAREDRFDGPDHAAARAQQALARAEALFDDKPGPRQGGREATLVLRDLFAARADLSPSDRAAADRILARPTDSNDYDYYGRQVTTKRACGTHVCVHWATSGPEASTNTYASRVLKTMNGVHQAYVAAGYRAPKSDKGRGGNNKPDIYLAQIGDQGGLYGYCTSDQSLYVSNTDYSVWAYCVLDNDYSQAEYASGTPLGNMRVTAAHEYMHAVQYAYDYGEDAWIMEASSTWAEDELFDAVDDNVQYLPEGQLGTPSVPLDKFDGATGGHYGNWIWLRYLTEKYPASSGGMPTLVRNLWRELDSTNGARNDRYSLTGLRKELAERGTSLKKEYARFSVENNTPDRTYDEAVENEYPSPRPAFANVTVTPAAPTHSRNVMLDHMTSATGAFVPASSMGMTWELRVTVNMTPTETGSRAGVTVLRTDGSVERSYLSLDSTGAGSKTVPFGRAQVEAVQVTLVNASDRMRDCFTDPNWTYACMGYGRDDDLTQNVSVAAFE